MYGYDFKAKKKTGFRGRAPGSAQEQRERKIFIFGILLLLTSMLSFGAGVFLYHRPTGSTDALLQRLYSGMLCGFFRDGLTFWDLAKSYLWIVAPLLLLFISVFGSLTFPYSALVIAGKGFLSGYTCAALLDLQSPGAGGILRFLLFLISEGAILLLTLSFAREGLLFREETRCLPSVPKKKLKTLLLDLLFLCGILLLLFFLRGFLCSFG